MTQGLGYEFAKFRLKEGISQEVLLEASSAMDEYFFPTQDGFISHTLIGLEGSEYMDMIIATTKENAERICGNWYGNGYCEAFLAAVDTESVSIGFGISLTNMKQAA